MIRSLSYPNLKFLYQKTSKQWFQQEQEFLGFWRHNAHNNLITERSLALLDVNNGQLRRDFLPIPASIHEIKENF